VNLFDTVIQRSVEEAEDALVSLRFGTVKAVTGSTLTVELVGTNVAGVAVLSSYTPKVGDRAWLLNQGSLLVAIGCTKFTTEGAQDA
jgi:hypothetical protein